MSYSNLNTYVVITCLVIFLIELNTTVKPDCQPNDCYEQFFLINRTKNEPETKRIVKFLKIPIPNFISFVQTAGGDFLI